MTCTASRHPAHRWPYGRGMYAENDGGHGLNLFSALRGHAMLGWAIQNTCSEAWVDLIDSGTP